MIYKFKCAAAGDLILLGPQGDQLLRLLGREPAAQGVIEVDAMPVALSALQAAIDHAESAAADADPGATAALAPATATSSPTAGSDANGAGPAVGLRQRLWPVMALLRTAHAAQARVVWGV